MRIDQIETAYLLDLTIAGANLKKTTRQIPPENIPGVKRPNPLFFAVRESDGYLWVDINTWGYTADTSWEKAAQSNNNIPNWATANKVVAVIQADIVPHEGR